MTRREMEQRMDYLRTQIDSIQNEMMSGPYPNWYPQTLKQFTAEWKALVITHAKASI